MTYIAADVVRIHWSGFTSPKSYLQVPSTWAKELKPNKLVGIHRLVAEQKRPSSIPDLVRGPVHKQGGPRFSLHNRGITLWFRHVDYLPPALRKICSRPYIPPSELCYCSRAPPVFSSTTGLFLESLHYYLAVCLILILRMSLSLPVSYQALLPCTCSLLRCSHPILQRRALGLPLRRRWGSGSCWAGGPR